MTDFELRPDGTVMVRAGDSEWVLPRPTLGQYRQAFEKFQAVDDVLQAAIVNVTDATEKVKIANRLQLGENGSAPLYGQLLVDLMAIVLPDAQLPNAADLPAWAVSSDAAAQILRWWRAVPLGPGLPG